MWATGVPVLMGLSTASLLSSIPVFYRGYWLLLGRDGFSGSWEGGLYSWSWCCLLVGGARALGSPMTGANQLWAGLSPSMIGCLDRRCHRTSTDQLVGSYIPSTNRLEERSLQKFTCQHQCPHWRMSSQKWLLPGSTSSGGVPVASCLSENFSKIWNWVRLRLLSKYCFCTGSQSTWDFAYGL